MAIGCLQEEDIVDFAAGRHTDVTASHIDGCEACRQIVAAVLADDVSEPMAHLIGRYILLEPIGGGATAIVYAGYDPELDRRVAVKVLHLRITTAQMRDRVTKEARALARLRNQNVVAIYDLGVQHERLYLVMELIEGQNLREWLNTQARSWGAIAQVFADVGRGLQAVHDSGLLHRDVKPENIVVTPDGHARLADFGVARLVREALHAQGPDDAVSSSGFGGTPAYMAPEQLSNRAVDVRADVFAFCVTLFEAVEGRRPFEGATVDALVRGMNSPAPRVRRAPAWVADIIARGLHKEASHRFANMAQLLVALADDPRKRWGKRAMFGVLSLGLGALAITSYLAYRSACDDGARAVASVWNATQRARVSDTQRAELDAFSAEFRTQHLAACRDSRERGEQSQDVLDERMHCLKRKLGQVDAHLRGNAVLNANDLALTECADVRALKTAYPLPIGDDLRVALLADEALLSELEVSIQMHRDVLAPLLALHERSQTLHYPPFVARAELNIAWVFENTNPEAALSWHKRLAVSADIARDDLLRARALTHAIDLAAQLGRVDEAWALFPFAEGAVQRSGRPEMQVNLETVQASLANLEGDLEREREHRAKSYHIMAASGRAPAFMLAHAQAQLCELSASLDPPETALIACTDAQIAADAALQDHPAGRSAVFHGFAILHRSRGEWEQALDAYSRAIALVEDNIDARRDYLRYLVGRAETLTDGGDRVRARVDLEKAHDFLPNILDPRSTLSKAVEQGLARAKGR